MRNERNLRFMLRKRYGSDRRKSKKKFEKVFERGKREDLRGKMGELDGVKIGNFRKQRLDASHTLRHKVNVKPDQWEKAKSLYLAGMDWKAIANDLQLSQATLQTKASREGITKLKREVKHISPKKEISLETLSALVRSKLAEDAAATIERVNGYNLDGIRDESTREQILGSVAKRSALVFGWSETGESPQVSVNILGALPDRTEVRVEPETK